MKRMSARGALLGVVAFVAMLAFGSAVASAVEGTAAGWYWQNPLAQGNSLRDVDVQGARVVAVGDAGAIFTSGNGGSSWTRAAASGMRGFELLSVDLQTDELCWVAGNGGIMKGEWDAVHSRWDWAHQTVPGAGTYTFSSVSFANSNDGWACGSFTVDGSATACRVVRTTNGGATWSVVEQWSSSAASKAPVQFLRQIDFVSPTTGWATGWGYSEATHDWGYVVLSTTDAGDTWTVARFGDGRAAVTAIDFTSATDGWAASGAIDGYVPATIWRTTDGGATWTASETREGSTISDLAATTGGECFVAGQAQGMADWTGFILHTADAGATWSEEFTEDGLKPNAVAFSASAAVAVGDGSLRLTRDSATATWGQYEPGVRKNLTNVQFWDSSLGWAVGWKSTILRTTNGGKKWSATSVPSGISLESIDMVTKKTGWAVGCSGPHVPYSDLDAGYGAVVLKTTDGGLHWKFQLNRTTRPGLAGVDFTDAKHGVAVGTAGLVARTQDGGKTWWLRTVGSETLRDVKFLSSTSGVAVGGDTNATSASGSVWQTLDGGAAWKEVELPQDEAHTAAVRALFVETIAGGSTLTAVGDRSQIYDSGDGVSWAFTDMTPAIVTQDPPYMLGLDIGLTTLVNPEKVAGDDVTGWVLSDEGAVWTKNGGEWMLPPTVASFTPESGPAGTTLTIYGSGFKPRISRDSGAIGWVDVTDGGSGYAEAPLVAIESPLGGRQATATAVIDATGMVTAIEVTDGGSGYTPGAYSVAISAPPAGGVTATATAFSVASAAVEFAGGTLAVPSSVSDSVLTVEVPLDAVTGRFAVTTINGTGWSPGRLEVLGTTPETQTHLSNHSGGSGQDNQLHGLAVVDWVNAWAVGDRGTILSFDRLAPATTVSPANGWVKTPSLTLTANDAKSGVWATRWVVDPPGIEGNVRPPIGDWESWEWQYGSTVTFKGRQEGDAPGARHVIYYQAIDNVGNVELDPFWRGQAADDPEYEVPKHVWVTLDTEGPQTYAPWAVTVKRNSKPAFDFWVNDDLSDKAKVTIVVKNGAGSTVKTLSLGWLATWHEFSSPISDWKCTLAKGAYTFEVRAVDQAGNSQQVPAGGNTFTVR